MAWRRAINSPGFEYVFGGTEFFSNASLIFITSSRRKKKHRAGKRRYARAGNPEADHHPRDDRVDDDIYTRDRLGLRQNYRSDRPRPGAFADPPQRPDVSGAADQHRGGIPPGRRTLSGGGAGGDRRGPVRHGGWPRGPRDQSR